MSPTVLKPGAVRMRKHNKFMKRVFVALFLLFSASACGYSLHGRVDYLVSDMKIGRIENRTREPRLDDILTSALSDEAQRQGLSVGRGSQNELHGSIERFEFRGVSEKQQTFDAYEVIVGGKFFLRTADGKDVPLGGENPFIFTFAAKADLNVVFAERQRAVEAALRGLAAEIVAGIVYR